MLPCPAKMAVLEQAVGPPEQAMAYLNIRLRIRAIPYGLASLIAEAVVAAASTIKRALTGMIQEKAAMVAQMVGMAASILTMTVTPAVVAVLMAAVLAVMVAHISVNKVPAKAQLTMVLAAVERGCTTQLPIMLLQAAAVIKA